MQIKLSFLGAAQNVTGSRFLVQANGKKLLVDCGLYQERQFADRNWDPFPIPPASLDGILLTHAHLDHCGLLPKLVREGFSGKIFCTPATAEIARIVMLDSAHIQEEDAQFKRRRHKREGRTPERPVEPLYNTEDAQNCAQLLSPVRYEKALKIGDGIEATFHDAGHILGASMIMLKVTENDECRRMLFSGDVGQCDRPILRDPTVFEEADYVITEATYGDRAHDEKEDVAEALAEVINSTEKAGGNIIIPSFAIERSQEVLYHLNKLLLADRIPHLMVYLDSPMAIRVTEVFRDHPEMYDEEMNESIRRNESPFDFPGLQMTAKTSQSKAINHIRGTVIVIAGSGMCTGGRVKHHLVNNISRPESTILFVGYQANGTPGRSILDGAKRVRILGEKRDVRARIARITGFSAHAGRNQLFDWISNLKNTPRHVFVVHGEASAAESYAKLIKDKAGWPVSVPAYQDEVVLD